MEQIDLAKFNFDADEVVKGAAELKKQIDALKKEQKELKDNNEESSLAYVENEAALKSLRKEYQLHLKTLADSAKQTQNATVRQQKLDLALHTEANTIKGLREQNKLLNELRNETNIATKEGVAELELLNAKLDENNEIIKENVDAYTRQKINIGNYKQDIKEALEEVDLFSGGLTNLRANLIKVAVNSKNAGGPVKLFGGALKTATKGMLGLIKASLAFLATPIGAVLGIVVAAFLLVRSAMQRSEESTNKLKKAFAPFIGIIKGVMKLLEPLAEFLIDGVVFALEAAEKAVFAIQEAFADLLDFLGFETAANGVRKFSEQMQQAAQDAKDLADAEADLTKQQRKARLTQLEYQKEAEKLRQLRDNEQLSLDERVAANERLGAVLEQQLQDELAIAQKALEVANLRLKADGESAATLDEQAAALEQIADIEERITSQRSEQLTNRTSLFKEAEAKRQEAIDATLEKMREELELYKASQSIRALTLAEELEQEQALADKRKEILEEELRFKRISQTAYAAAVKEIYNNLARSQAELVVDTASKELQAYRKAIDARLDSEDFLSSEILAKKTELNNQALAKELEFQKLRLDQGVINQNEFDAAIEAAKEANRIANATLAKEREAIEKEENKALRLIEFEEELERLALEGATKLELEQAQAEQARDLRIAQVEEERQNNLISEELYRAKLAQIDRQYKAGEKKREEILAAQKLNAISGVFAAASGIIDKNSAAGKALALAQAGINMYQGISAGVKLGYPQAIPAVAAAVATGGKAIADISKTKVPSASGGGSVGGGAASTAAAGAVANLTGSGVNLNAVAASGNEAIRNQIENAAQQQGIADAVERGATNGSRQGSTEGIERLSENRAIQDQSGF